MADFFLIISNPLFTVFHVDTSLPRQTCVDEEELLNIEEWFNLANHSQKFHIQISINPVKYLLELNYFSQL